MDMVSVQIQDFCNLLELCRIKNEKQRQLYTELTIQKMITLNQQNLIEDGQLVAFFRNLEVTDITAMFNKSDIILNKFQKPRLITCFNEIPLFQRYIKLGIVHEIYVNTNHLEEFVGHIPQICSDRLRTYATRYQTVFFFRIWSVWEERKYIKLYPSV